MNEKKMDLIESGMKLFAQKGYHKTSIQEIASKAGISKGGFYLYFNSKEEFIATALHYFHTQITKRIAAASMGGFSPKQSLKQQINSLTEYVFEHRNFIIMHLREDISIGQHAEQFFQQMKIDNYHWLKDNVQDIYGDKIDPYLFDIIIQLEGLINGFLKWLVIENLYVEKDRIGPYIINRLDEIVQGILRANEEPLISLEALPVEYKSFLMEQANKEKLQKLLLSMDEKISNMKIDLKRKTQLQEVIEIVLKKVTQQERQNLMIQGLLAHFTSVPELKNECEQIADILQIELLD